MSSVLERIASLTQDVEIKHTRDDADTLDLRYGVWRAKVPASGKVKRWIVFLNGRTEWVEKYAYLPADLGLPNDCGFLTWDHRGQGASGGARAFVDSYESYARDAAKIVGEVVKDAPYVVLTHSMGGLIAMYATLTGRLAPQAMVLSSPLFGLPVERLLSPGGARAIARLTVALKLGLVNTGAGSFTRSKFASNPLTHHVDLYERMRATPYPVSSATFGWVAATLAAIDHCFAPTSLAKLSCPTLIMGGTKELVVDHHAFRSFVEAAGKHSKAKVMLKLIQGGRHELLAEIPDFYDAAVAEARAFFAEGW